MTSFYHLLYFFIPFTGFLIPCVEVVQPCPSRSFFSSLLDGEVTGVPDRPVARKDRRGRERGGPPP